MLIRKSNKLIGVLSTLALLSGCAIAPELIKNKDGEDTPEFKSLWQIMKDDKEKDLKVLYVHGMGHHNKDFADSLVKSILETLGKKGLEYNHEFTDVPLYSHIKKQALNRIPDSSKPELKQDGNLRVWQLSYQGRRITLGALQWSDITLGMKDKYLTEDGLSYIPSENGNLEPTMSLQNPSSVQRANLNNAIRKLMNDGFADVVQYLGKQGKPMRSVIRDGLCRLVQNKQHFQKGNQEFYGTCDFSQENNDYNLAVISSSLGSKMVYDTFNELLQSKSKDVNFIRSGHTIYSYMFTNQLPLLEMANHLNPFYETDKEYKTKQESDPTQHEPITLYNQHKLFKAKKINLEVVDFMDPNDLLGWSIPPKVLDKKHANDFKHAFVINQSRYVPIMDLMDPAMSHSCASKNPHILNLIIYGKDNPEFPFQTTCTKEKS